MSPFFPRHEWWIKEILVEGNGILQFSTKVSKRIL